MKNIHVLPTDKLSRLFVFEGKLLLVHKYITDIENANRHIYITSDEEIKEGDWVFDVELSRIKKCLYSGVFRNWKKIILTTDPDLIADGVQAIDDEFLEWFVKNPSFEEVKIELHIGSLRWEHSKNTYKIIIPQEEPEISDEAKERAKNYMALKGALEVKEETLEKAAKKYAESNQYDLEYYDEGGYQGIEVESFAEKLVDFTTKWQAERMYSEEEVLELLRKAHFVEQNIEEWFEQHKKK